MLYFEDFSEGRRFDYKPVEMKPADMIAFAREFDPQPMHLDEEAGKLSILGGLSASGWHTSAVGMRMMLDAFMGHSSSQGSPGIDFMDWKKPVIAGDVLTGFSQVLEARRSKSKPSLGIVKFRNEIVNQTGEPVAVSECTVLFRCRDKGQN
ncbi:MULTISPECIES: MaoC family dehydratase [Ensifer]|jgi:acyl dehydratase|uniref:MaoC family dehydratase n=1 Tax=Ensifer TaxID=106591 RepID=UPI00042E2BA6|nr:MULTISPECIES: MaoC family dehydratase [Ensifer]AHK45057.1 MaoC-like dehydratase [Ensifer adhaerens OV14]KQU85803.1 enoyl-CoA hydratase [Ensifer sp. Root31]KQW53963.1 enoyl-CoA hydratase [Ensifer sp. Root1252]KQY68833.1 enoyl-CoA hydratase [Ensifer sp. Root142]KRC69140.1 enoyl-CoA hydratase [Ensifer sp. Root231]